MNDPSLRASAPALLRQAAWIDGAWIPAVGDGIPVTDPATGERLGEVPDLGAAATERAIRAAAGALPGWSAQTVDARAAVLSRIEALLGEREAELAALITRENGKPLAESVGEIRYTAGYFRWYAEEVRRLCGQLVPAGRPGRRILVTRQPVGVCAMITPWNFPLAMLGRKLAAALAAGCTVAAKPSELTPFSALALAEICADAGLPAGAFNVVTGQPEAIGAALTGSRLVRKLSFTGSTRVGRLLTAQCAPTLKRLSMELGGSAPFIVFEDADLEAAAEGAIASKFRNCGQTCVASNRFLVHEDALEGFLAALLPRVAALKRGDGLVEGVQIGPMINAAGADKVRALARDALAKGASLRAGEPTSGADGDRWLDPAVLVGVTDEMAIWRAEIFGPLIAIRTFRDEAGAIRLANDTEMGLAAYLYTRDAGRIWRAPEALEYGMVGVNTGMISDPRAPFGGVKQSGSGREGGPWGLEDYLQIKYTCVEL